MNEPLNINPPKRIQIAAIVALSCLSLFLLVKTFGAWSDIDNAPIQNTITVTGQGETFAVPDIGAFTFSVIEEGSSVAEAQKKATTKNNEALKYIKSMGVEDKDIKTESYNAYPKYEYPQIVCVRYPCPPAKETLSGYEVSQTISVKVRNVDKAGDILSGVGEFGVSNISGLTFTIDNEDALKTEARSKAIADAKDKASVLVKDLGVRLGRVVSFSEDSGGYPYPIYTMEAKGMGMGGGEPAPDIATGENKITINVTVTYRIK